MADALSRRAKDGGRIDLPSRGWLCLTWTCPSVACAGGASWIFGPEEPYELFGDVGNVVFPGGYTLAPDGDTLNLYYGGADSCIALATGSVRRVLEWLQENSLSAARHPPRSVRVAAGCGPLRCPLPRLPVQLVPDRRRVITRLFTPGGEKRIRSVLNRVLRMDEQDVEGLLARIVQDFAGRHRNMGSRFNEHFLAGVRVSGRTARHYG